MITREEQERDYQIHCAAIDAADDELNHLEELTFEVNAKADYDNGFIRGFKTGVAWADEHPKSPWIKFKDRKPEIGRLNCVIVNQGENVFIAHLDYCSVGLYWNMYGHRSMPVSEDDKWIPIPKLEEE